MGTICDTIIGKWEHTSRGSLRNLYFTGSDIFMHGIIGSFLSGVITTSAICGKILLSEFSKR
jgi:hypothetical protein